MKGPPTEAALLYRGLENRDLAVQLPYLDIVTVSELKSLFFRSMVIGAKQIERHYDMAVVSDNIRAILAHADTPERYLILGVTVCRPGSRRNRLNSN